MVERIELQADATHRKMRLEDFLLDHFGSLSKMYLRELVKTAHCEVNGRHENIGYKLRPKDFVEITVDRSRGTAMRPENIALDIVFEDDEIIVVNKPAGMLAHPSHRENSGTLLNAVVFHLNRELLSGGASTGLMRPGLIHRLDKQTSGLMVLAKTSRSHRIMTGHFMKKRVEKRYLALVEGSLEKDEGVIEAPIGRFAELKFWGVKADGKHSVSRYWVRKRLEDSTLVELEPVTGRTNQLRIHCELLGHPIVGDVQRNGREFQRLCLHAHKLSFPHPASRQIVSFEEPVDFT